MGATSWLNVTAPRSAVVAPSAREFQRAAAPAAATTTSRLVVVSKVDPSLIAFLLFCVHFGRFLRRRPFSCNRACVRPSHHLRTTPDREAIMSSNGWDSGCAG